MSHLWKLSINPTKCRVLHGGLKNTKQTYYIDGNPIAEDNSVRDLGVLVDYKLTFKSHIAVVIRNAYFHAHQLLRVLHTTNLNTQRLAYLSHISPLLEYATEIWNPHFIIDIKRIEKV